MGSDKWAHLMWAVVVDARQFFGTFTDAEDLVAGIFPQSNLGTTRLMVQAHTTMRIRDTLAQWLPLSPTWQPAKSRAEDLGGTRTGKKRQLGGDTDGVGTEGD